MKQILFSFILIFSFNQVNAQFSEDNAIYQTSEITIGNYLGFGVHANYVWKEKYSFKIGYSGICSNKQPSRQNSDTCNKPNRCPSLKINNGYE